MGRLTVRNGHDEIEHVGEPDNCDGHVDWPFQLCVLLALGETQRERDDSRDNDQIPPDEGKPGQFVAPQTGGTGSLHSIEGSCHQGTTTVSENYRIGMQRA